MRCKRNPFFIFSLILFLVITAYAFFLAVSALTSKSALGAGVLVWLLTIIAAVLLLTYLISRYYPLLKPYSLTETENESTNAFDIATVIVLLAALMIRIWVIRTFPVAPSSDYQTYYQVAEQIYRGILSSSGYSGYIAEFPHVIGFPFVLSLLFHFTGPSYIAGLYFNAVVSVLSAFLSGKIAEMLGGRVCGFISLLFTAFWPSQILYSALLASEPVFSLLLLSSIWLFIFLYRFPARIGTIEGSMFLCCVLGFSLALANAIRPMATIFLIALILCFLPCKVSFSKNEKLLYSIVDRFSCQGWFRALAILLSFMFVGNFLSKAISNTIAFSLPSGLSSSGFNLLVGTNIEARGAWNQADAEFLASNFAASNSGAIAQSACFNEAIKRISQNPVGVLKLTFEKVTYLWADDDYANYWVGLFLNQQSALTAGRQALLDGFRAINSFYYLIFVAFTAVFGFFSLKKKYLTPAMALVLLLVGTAVLHMVLECQNRYHYFLLPVLVILSSLALKEIYSKIKSKGI